VERETRPRDEEIEALKEKVEMYEKRLGKPSPYPSGEVLNMLNWLEGSRIRFGLVADTHIGSKMARQDCLEATYTIFDKEGINRVFHCGDMTSGNRVYKGQEHETKYWGFDEQRDAVVKLYPHLKDGKTFWILGNHDASHLTLAGADIGEAIAKLRNDLIYVGQVEVDVKLARNTTLRLRHPSGGGAYALSYPMQKYINSLEGGQKPNILAQGHYHTRFEMEYRNIFAFQVPCYESQSLWLKEKGLQPVTGAWIVDAMVDKKGSITRLTSEAIKFY
jgi:predicted phosphodiesterase